MWDEFFQDKSNIQVLCSHDINQTMPWVFKKIMQFLGITKMTPEKTHK